jgi:hypothetical protein
MATGTLAIVGVIGGKSVNQTITKTFDHPNNYEGIALAAGKEVTDWVKTDADTADCNLPAGHGYSSGKMDVYWSGGMRYDVDGTVVTNALTLDGGTGDDFPASATEDIIVCTPTQINTAIDGDEIALLVANCSQRCSLYFEDSGDSAVGQIEITAANVPFFWHDTSGLTNPLTGNPITVCFASNGSATAATLDILSGEDSTP